MASKWLPASLSSSGLRKNPALLPLLFFTGLGGVWCGYYVWRLAVKSPEVVWNRHANPEPWNEKYENKQYKFYSDIDHSKIVSERPKF